MAGEIEEPFRFNFQADLLHSGSISFGRFESESLSWERRSSFSHNRYLEEVEKYSKPGSVTEKKAYFEAHFRRKALLKQNSSESQDGREFQTSENNNSHDLQESDNSNEETELQNCVNENVETLECERDELGVFSINNVDHMVTGPDHLKLEETHQIGTTNVDLVKSEEITKVPPNDTVVMAGVDSEIKQPKPKLKANANFPQVQKIISSEASNSSAKPRSRGIKGLIMKEKEKKSPRSASPIAHSVRKSSKLEELSTSYPKAKIVPKKKSIAKEYRSEKTLETRSIPGASQTVYRTKETFVTPSKPHVNQSAAGFTFKNANRASERRKEEKKAAAEMTQFRRSLNFKATPMPSFYKESARCLDQNKVLSSSQIPNRPGTSSMVPSTKKVPSNSANSSNPRPSSSSTSLTNRNRLPEPSRRVQEKKKELSSQKQKEHEATKGPRARDTKGVHTGTGLGPKLGYLAVGVAT